MTLIPLDRLTQGATHFHCERLNALQMSVSTCIARQTATRSGTTKRRGKAGWATPLYVRECLACPVGDQITAHTGVVLPEMPEPKPQMPRSHRKPQERSENT